MEEGPVALSSEDEAEPTGRNEFGLDDEVDTNSTSSLSQSSSTDPSKKKWIHSEIISMLKTGELKEVKNDKSKKEFWNNFKIIIDKNGRKLNVARCIGCRSFLQYGTSSSVLSRHSCMNRSSAVANTPSISGHFSKQATIGVTTKSKAAKSLAYFCAKDMRPFEVNNFLLMCLKS